MMAPITSRSALDYYELLNAVSRSLRYESDTDDFLTKLHDQGFMVVPIPTDPEPEPAPIEPERPSAAVPNAPPVASPPLSPIDTMTRETATFEEWLAVAIMLPEGEEVSVPDLRFAFNKGMTPRAGVELGKEIPF